MHTILKEDKRWFFLRISKSFFGKDDLNKKTRLIG